MKLFAPLAVITLFALSFAFTACQSSGGPGTFCDTTCNNNPLSFSINHPDSPFISISMKDCFPDTVTWSHDRLPETRKALFSTLAGKEVRIQKDFVHFYIKDTSYIWMLFNDCSSGQGFLVKIPFNKSGDILRKNGALNSFEPRFSLAPNLAAYTDRGNIFVEDMTNGKKGMITFGKKIETIDYTDMRASFDTVNITPDRVWVKIRIDNEWQTIEKPLTLK